MSPTSNTRICTKCGYEKPLGEFGLRKGYRDGIKTWCKACEGRQTRSWRARNPEKRNAQVQRSIEKRPGRIRDLKGDEREKLYLARRNGHLVRKYGITLRQYLEMHEAQRGLCAACGEPPPAPAEAHQHDLVVDHDHRTGEVRGLLCDRCNRALGIVDDDQALLARLTSYLLRRA